MATRPDISSRQLMTLGMFVFSVETALYQALLRTREWRHATSERFGARAIGQFIGPGVDRVDISGLLVPEIAGSFSALETIAEMADTGEQYPLIDGLGRIFGEYRIVRLEEDHLIVMGGGLPRQVGFRIELERGDDPTDEQGLIEQGDG